MYIGSELSEDIILDFFSLFKTQKKDKVIIGKENGELL